MKIIIVDDEQISFFVIQQKLLAEGAAKKEDISGFLSAQEALDALLQWGDRAQPDVILLDLNMPAMDGWQFLDALALMELDFQERCQIYVLTSSLAGEDEARARGNALVTGFFLKPLNSQNIQTIMQAKPHCC